MPSTILRDERTYRRGLVMGLTLAEVMVLVLFALLLLFGWVVQRNAVDIQLLDALRSLLPVAVGAGSPAENEITNAVEELKVATETGRRVIATLRPAKGASTDDAKVVAIRATDLIELGKQAESALGPNSSGAAATTSAREALAVAQTEYDKARREDGHGSARIWLQWLIRNQPNRGNGNGLVFPSCVEVDGKPAYVFDVTLKSGSLFVRNNSLPEMMKWVNETNQIQFNNDVSNDEFESMTTPLFEWSRLNQCRFFVRVIDATLPDQKSIYKARLRTVEGHFYKFLVQSDDDRF